MSGPKNPRDERVDPTREDAEEMIEDLEPGEGEGDEVKGGGGSTQSLKPGSEPQD